MSNASILFVHDHVFHLDKISQKVYSSGCFPAVIWERYLAHFSKISILARKSNNDGPAELKKLGPLSSKSGVEFLLCDGASDLRSLFSGGGKARDVVRESVSNNDAVIARLTSELGLLAIYEAERQGKPWAVELVDCPWDSYWNYGGLKAKAYAPISYFRVSRVLRRSKFSLYVTEKFLQKRYPSPFAINSIGCSNVEISEVDRGVLYRRLGKNRDKLVLGQIASLKGKFKGIQTVMYSLLECRKSFPNIEYRILGAGDQSQWRELARKIGVDDICFFDGVLPSGQGVFEWLDEIDIYVHPSFKEGLPRAVIEAMSRGCPVIASDVAGIPELISEDYLVKPGDFKGLAHKVVGLANDLHLMNRLSSENFNMASYYSKEILDARRHEFWSSFSEYIFEGSKKS